MAGPSPFVMHGAREAMASGLAHIEEQVTTIERAVVENPALAFDLAKTLVESTCKAVLGERAGANDDLPKLFREATRQLVFVPEAVRGDTRVDESLKRTLSGLNGAVQGICELRNQCGFASHGSGEPRPALGSVQALLAASAADAVVGFLYRTHRQAWDEDEPRPLRFEDHAAFNGHVDETHGAFRVFDSEFRASEVLFHMEPETYRIYLTELDGDGDPEAER